MFLFWWTRIAIPLLCFVLALHWKTGDDQISIIVALQYVTGCNMLYWFLGDFNVWLKKRRHMTGGARQQTTPAKRMIDWFQELWEDNNLFLSAWFFIPLPIAAFMMTAMYFIGGPQWLPFVQWNAIGLMWLGINGFLLCVATWVLDFIACCLGNFVGGPYSGDSPWRSK